MSIDYEIYDLGDVKLQRGATLRGCKLAYKTFGTLNAAKDNVIVYPTWYSGQHTARTCWVMGCRPRPATRRSLITGRVFRM